MLSMGVAGPNGLPLCCTTKALGGQVKERLSETSHLHSCQGLISAPEETTTQESHLLKQRSSVGMEKDRPQHQTPLDKSKCCQSPDFPQLHAIVLCIRKH